MGDLQRSMLQTSSLPRKAFREASLQRSLWAFEQLQVKPMQRPQLALEQQDSSSGEACESRPQLLVDRFTCKYVLQGG